MSVVHVFTDESGTHPGAPYFVIGGLWIDGHTAYANLTSDLNDICNAHSHHHELAWKKICPRFRDCYLEAIDRFFTDDQIAYNSISVNKAKVDYNKYHRGSEELGFYKFYYQLFKQRLDPGREHVIRLDRMRNMRHYIGRLKSYCNSHLMASNPGLGITPIKEMQAVDSVRNPAIQLADVITGAIAASYQGNVAKAERLEVVSRICRKTRLTRLNCGTPLRVKHKFNNWEIQLN